MNHYGEGFNLDYTDDFKTYEGYECLYIIDYYIRDKHDYSSIIETFDNFIDAMQYMDDNELWDDYQIMFVKSDGTATNYLEL